MSPRSASQLSDDDLLAALRPVQDPDLHRSIVDLGLVREVGIRKGKAVVIVGLVHDAAHLPAEMTRRVSKALLALDGVDDVTVRPFVLDAEELQPITAMLRGDPGGQHEHAGQSGHGHAAGPSKAIPFMEATAKTRVLGISSGKGGVGKSSVTVNVAVSLHRLGFDVGIVDADIYGYSIPRMLGILDGHPTVLDDGSDNPLILPPEGHGIRAISMDYFVPDDKAVMWRGPMIHKALENFLTDIYWGEPDFLLFDMPPGTGDVALSMAQYLPRAEMYVVTTPQPAAQRVAKKTALMARDPKVNLRLAGVIENMSWFVGDDGKRYELFGAGGGQALADELATTLIGQIPFVPDLREGGDVGLPITISDPASEAAQIFESIAKWIVANGPKRVFRKELKITS